MAVNGGGCDIVITKKRRKLNGVCNANAFHDVHVRKIVYEDMFYPLSPTTRDGSSSHKGTSTHGNSPRIRRERSKEGPTAESLKKSSPEEGGEQKGLMAGGRSVIHFREVASRGLALEGGNCVQATEVMERGMMSLKDSEEDDESYGAGSERAGRDLTMARQEER
ncbi:puratrophin-1 [Sesbania bispinosa]|nr:puratrophin-1 [Sesbania bispinosa]